MLQVDKLNHFYGGSHTLNDISFEIPPNSCVALLGRNGVGKSTLLKSLMGVEPVRSGAVTLEGKDITHAKPYARARMGIGYVPQGREIFPRLTVEENLLTGLAGSKNSTIPSEIYEMFPVLKDMRRRRGGDLSGGQQQQLAIGRALTTAPKLLILDEPTEGIQPSIVKDIERVIRSLNEAEQIRDAIRMVVEQKRIAVLLVEQYYDFARALANHYLVMERGALIARGRGADMDKDGVRDLLSV